MESPTGAVFTNSQPDACVSPQVEQPGELRSAKSAANRVWELISLDMAVGLVPNPSHELFRIAAYATSILVFGVQGEEMLGRVPALL
jgi:hypothetical protein